MSTQLGSNIIDWHKDFMGITQTDAIRGNPFPSYTEHDARMTEYEIKPIPLDPLLMQR